MVASPALFERIDRRRCHVSTGQCRAVDEAVGAHHGYRHSWFASMIGPLVVSDQKLAEIGRAHRRLAIGPDGDTAEPLAVSVVNTSGAGGLLSLAGRTVEGVQVVAVESALRDLDDLAGNAARVVSAAAQLDDPVRVFVEIPYAPGWERSGRRGRVGRLLRQAPNRGRGAVDTPPADQLASQLSVLIEADLPFKATAGLHHAVALPGSEPVRPAPARLPESPRRRRGAGGRRLGD